MSVRHPGSARASVRRRTAMVGGLLVLALAATACQSKDSPAAQARQDVSSAAPSPSAPPKSAARIVTNVPLHGTVHVDKLVSVTAHQGTLDQVSVDFGAKHQTLPGRLSADKTSWHADARLEPGVRYRIKAVAEDAQGLKTTQVQRFRAEPLSLAQQTFPSIAPLNGETVGVGMPVIVHFDVPVKDKATIEKHLHVTNTSHQAGAWHWISDNEVHWRPAQYWKPGTTVTVRADVNSIPAGNGIYGQVDNAATFHIGDAIINKVNVASHRMRTYVNGKLIRTMPISAGKPGFITRSGVKVIIEKTPSLVMDSTTVGIPKSSPDYYKLKVLWDMRVTYSGEFVHAAPWSDSSHGIANVSHGCVGLSTSDAEWLYHLTHGRGDIVDVTGSDRHMTLTNGYGDWNESFAEYKKGSALS